jgi:hypothetical protein
VRKPWPTVGYQAMEGEGDRPDVYKHDRRALKVLFCAFLWMLGCFSVACKYIHLRNLKMKPVYLENNELSWKKQIG